MKLYIIKSTSFIILENMTKVQKKFSVVEFPDGLQIVPSCWIDKDKNECIWPGYIKSQYTLDRLLTKAIVPDETVKWDICRIKRIFGSAG